MRGPIRLAALVVVLLPLSACASSSTGAGGGPVERELIQSRSPLYTPAVRAGDTYYFSGKLGVSGETRAMTEGRTGAEVRNIMDSFQELFDEIGISFADVVKATVMLADLDDYGEMNEAWAPYFAEGGPPAREAFEARLVSGAMVEISFIAIAR